MSNERLSSQFASEHLELTRRFFLALGVGGATGLVASRVEADPAGKLSPSLRRHIEELESWLTVPDDFRDVSRGNPKPHSLEPDQRVAAGLTRETWRLEITADPESKPRLGRTFTKEDDTAFTFQDLMELAKSRSVRFAKIMTCLNLGCPLGNGIWEGVPLRDVLWMAEPSKDIRRVHYYGYHNNDPKQMFRSSLPIGRVLEDYFGLPPVILCYKLNGEWLTPERGAPVRIVVPEAYGFKNIKWLSNIVLSNRWQANDTYGERNNDVDSPLKTFCETLYVPTEVGAQEEVPITGYAQVGISGLKKVQVWIQERGKEWPKEDKFFTTAPWLDAEILGAPKAWGGGLADDQIPADTIGFIDGRNEPQTWPMRFTKAHWAVLHPGLPPGDYTLRCRTVDDNGAAQPMPRPFRKSGRAAIQETRLIVKG